MFDKQRKTRIEQFRKWTCEKRREKRVLGGISASKWDWSGYIWVGMAEKQSIPRQRDWYGTTGHFWGRPNVVGAGLSATGQVEVGRIVFTKQRAFCTWDQSVTEPIHHHHKNVVSPLRFFSQLFRDFITSHFINSNKSHAWHWLGDSIRERVHRSRRRTLHTLPPRNPFEQQQERVWLRITLGHHHKDLN